MPNTQPGQPPEQQIQPEAQAPEQPPEAEAQPGATGVPTTPEGEELYQRAIVMLYDGNFEALKKTFEGIKPQQIPNKLSNAINAILDKMENDNEGITIDIIAEVGMRLLESLVADLSELGLLEGMQREHFLGAIADIINDYALNHKDTISPEQLQEFLQTLSGAGGQAPQQPGQAPPEQPQQQQQPPQPAQTGQPEPLLQQQPQMGGMQ